MNLPKHSAFLYPKGHKLIGQDGDIWCVIIDNRGINRWEKVKNPKKNLERLKYSIQAMKFLLNEEPDEVDNINIILENRIENLVNVGDDDSKEALHIYRQFKDEVFAMGGRIKDLNRQLKIYEEAYKKNPQEVLKNKINKIKKQKYEKAL